MNNKFVTARAPGAETAVVAVRWRRPQSYVCASWLRQGGSRIAGKIVQTLSATGRVVSLFLEVAPINRF
jgi:hypothetical protein